MSDAIIPPAPLVTATTYTLASPTAVDALIAKVSELSAENTLLKARVAELEHGCEEEFREDYSRLVEASMSDYACEVNTDVSA